MTQLHFLKKTFQKRKITFMTSL